jgi:hypothetical protein
MSDTLHDGTEAAVALDADATLLALVRVRLHAEYAPALTRERVQVCVDEAEVQFRCAAGFEPVPVLVERAARRHLEAMAADLRRRAS